MAFLGFHFEQPWFLALLAALPLLWAMGYRSLGSLGQVRRWFVLGMLTVVW